MPLAMAKVLEKSCVMQTSHKFATISVDDYLTDEATSRDRHEYVGGAVFAMAGASDDHNRIAGNLYAALRSHLRGKPCEAFFSDVKLRLEISQQDTFYYPDVMVTCDARDTDSYFKRYPQVLIEVLSPQTEHIDRREKFMSYIQIDSLQEYVLVAQDQTEVTVFRRSNRWQPEVQQDQNDSLQLASLNFTVALSLIYERVKFLGNFS
jgi:Uma2 family endonuclease